MALNLAYYTCCALYFYYHYHVIYNKIIIHLTILQSWKAVEHGANSWPVEHSENGRQAVKQHSIDCLTMENWCNGRRAVDHSGNV